MSLQSKASLADRGQAFGMRLITRAGGLDALRGLLSAPPSPCSADSRPTPTSTLSPDC